VPEDITFATKPQIARGMIEKAIAADVPFAWVAADSIYGVSEIEMMLRRQGKGYVLGVSGAHPFGSWVGKPEIGGTAEEIAEELDESVWQRLSAGAGTKGERLYDWAYCELADLEADEDRGSLRRVDKGASDPSQPERWRARVLLHLVPGWHSD
jgi:SRSO17 transposase